MSEHGNRRLVHVAEIERTKEFVKSRKFYEADKETLQVKYEMLRESYANFLEEHKKLIAWISKDKFGEEEKFVERIEESYQEMCIDFRRQTNVLEQNELMNRLNMHNTNESGQTATTTTVQEQNIIQKREQEQEEEKMNIEPDTNSEETQIESEIHVVNDRMETKNLNDLRNVLRHRRRIECNNCGRNHPMSKCATFLSRTVAERKIRVRELNLCRNCFAPYQPNRMHRCQSGSCRRCGKFHNSLLCSLGYK